ncbi:MAG: HAD-IC family P-type ATPase [Thermomicrobiales bacterium]|nr:HAD-IC family P-type ATPase [Thermomicrobiales bacterium]
MTEAAQLLPAELLPDVARRPMGLSSAEVETRRQEGLANRVENKTSRTYRQIVEDNLFTFINTTLLGIGFILILLGQPRDALMSSGLAVINAAIGVVQESIAKRRLDRIALLNRPTARVVRDGQEIEVDPAQLVIGDLLVVEPGDQILLDGTVAGAGKIDVDESLLTGETDSVHKAEGDTVYAGTYVLTGKAWYRAEKTSEQSVAGNIAAGARRFTVSLTPLQQDVNYIVRALLAIAIFLLALVLLSSIIWAYPFTDTVIGAAVILGIVPSGLFLMITVTYSMGALRLARQNALVQQVNAVESLSNVDVFCADKTGTLTANKLVLSQIQPIGDLSEDDVRSMLAHFASSMPVSNKTNDAIVAALPGTPQPLVGHIPFSSARKWSALSADTDALRGVYALGAPEMLGALIEQERDLDPPEGWAAQGWRVLLFASSPEPSSLVDADGDPAAPLDLRPVAWIAFADELRPNLHETLAGFRRAGVRLKVISGDNQETVAALARQAGFPADAVLVSGLDLARMNEIEFDQAAEAGDIFGRITPDQKERLVESMRRHGHYVAMTGDGVNDVLSIKKANLGIAMQSGAQATRAAADIVLLKDSFAAVPAAFREGQRIRRGLQSVLNLFLVRVFTVSLIIIAVTFVRGGFPFSPATMTLLTLLTVGIPTFALAIFAHAGRAPDRILMPLFKFVLPATILMFLVSVIVYLIFYFLSDVDLDTLRHASAAQVNNPDVSGALAKDALTYVMILCGLVLVVFTAPPNEWWAVIEETDRDWRPTAVAILMIPLYIAILSYPWSRKLFSVRLLEWWQYAIIAIAVVAWALGLRYAWQNKIFNRFVGFK